MDLRKMQVLIKWWEKEKRKEKKSELQATELVPTTSV